MAGRPVESCHAGKRPNTAPAAKRHEAHGRRHRPVEGDLLDAWQIGRELRDEQRQGPEPHSEAGDPAEQAKHRAFGQELPNDAAGPRAERLPHHDLTLAAGCPRK
jgi:hypothetical protein